MCDLPSTVQYFTRSCHHTALHGIDIRANISGGLINNLRFADDIVLSAKELQTLVNRVQNAASTFGLKINISKTQVQVISKQKQISDIKQRICKAVGAVQRLHTMWNLKTLNSNCTTLSYYPFSSTMQKPGLSKKQMKTDY